VLCCAVLCCAVLCCAVLCCAVLCCAVLWQEGREYTGLSVSFSILEALFQFGGGGNATATIDSSSSATTSSSLPQLPAEPSPALGVPHPACGEPPRPLNKTSATALASPPNILLVGDSISMGYGYYEEQSPHCACGDKTCCVPDYRLGYGLYVAEMLANATAGWTLATVQHNGGWYLGGQAGDTKLGLKCIEYWLGGGSSANSSASDFQWDLIHVSEMFE
jgi:hypothetical protein